MSEMVNFDYFHIYFCLTIYKIEFYSDQLKPNPKFLKFICLVLDDDHRIPYVK